MPGNSDQRMQNAGAEETARAAPHCYVRAAPLPEVWHEQLDSLVDHAGHNTPGCSECLRFAQVVRLLMRPFE